MDQKDCLFEFYKCDLCKYQSKLLSCLEHHTETHTLTSNSLFTCLNKPEPYRCEKCQFESPSKVILFEHVKETHRKQENYQNIIPASFICRTCRFTTGSILIYKGHVCKPREKKEVRRKKQVKPEWFMCDHCPFRTKFKKLLRPHIKHIHTKNVEKFECNICSTLFTKKSSLLQHTLYCHGNPGLIKWYECDQCPFKTKQKGNLTVHMTRVHSKAPTVKCPFCCVALPLSSLENHMKKFHSDPGEIIWYKCETCSLKYKHRRSLQEHILRHHERKWFQCGQCPFKCKYGGNLKEHTMRHHFNPDEMELLKCEKCSFKAKSKSEIYKHTQRVHTSKSWLACDQCSYRCKYLDSLRHHIGRSHVNESGSVNWTKCAHCDFQCERQADLRKHIDEIHASFLDQQCYKCDQCDFKTGQKMQLSVHTLNEHAKPEGADISV